MKSTLKITLFLIAGVPVALSGQRTRAQDPGNWITNRIMSIIGTGSMRTPANTLVREFAHNPGLRKQILQYMPPDVVTAVIKSTTPALEDNPSLRRKVFRSLPDALRVALISTGRNSAHRETGVASRTGKAQGGFARPQTEPAAMEAPLEDQDQSARRVRILSRRRDISCSSGPMARETSSRYFRLPRVSTHGLSVLYRVQPMENEKSGWEGWRNG